VVVLKLVGGGNLVDVMGGVVVTGVTLTLVDVMGGVVVTGVTLTG